METAMINELLENFNGVDNKELQKLINKIKESEKFPIFLESMGNLNKDLLYKSELHGISHNERVAIFIFYIGISEDLDDRDLRILLEAAKYHDIGRINNGIDATHGKRSAEKIDDIDMDLSVEEKEILKVICECHSIPDKNIESKIKDSGIADASRCKRLSDILKDADALDRVRLNYDKLNPKYLRTNSSTEIIKAAEELLNEYNRIKGYISSQPFSSEVLDMPSQTFNSEIFDINKFNIIQDEEYYYFFRTLSKADESELEAGLIIDENGNYLRMRTGRERWEEDPEKGLPRYTKTDSISLREVNDHIKIHQRKDTNCISLSSNANVSVAYGRGTYNDRYVIVKVPKNEMGQKVVNAGSYMLEEVEKRVNYAVWKIGDESSDVISLLNQIDNATTEEEIKNIIETRYQLKETYQRPKQRHEKIALVTPHTRTINYQALNEEQSLEKNKIIGKLTLLEQKGLIEPLIPNTSKNTSLIRTIGNAFSSLELIHYGDIEKEEIINVPKEIMDIFALLQQIQEPKQIVDEIKKEVIEVLTSGKHIEIPTTIFSDAQNKKDISIEEMYEITGGKISYGKANSAITKMFYLSKSKLRAKELANFLNEITLNNPVYQEVIRKIEETGFSIEPEIITRQNNKGYKLSESVNLDLSEQEEKIISELQSLTPENLLEIYQNGGVSNTQEILTKIYQEENSIEITKERYIAEAVVDSFDWASIGVGELTVTQRAQIIEKVENNEFELTKNLTIEQIETALGYYDIEGTNLTLRTHQQIAVDKADELLEERRFAAVILPTGAGKSFVALAELLKHKDEKILYLAPSNEILEQIQKYIIEYVHGTKGTLGKTNEEIIKEVFPNLELATYASLNGKNGKETIENNYDFIVLDELHRTGAEKWGKKLEKLLENQDETVKVLGITATPERDMDGRNMADEIAEILGYTEEEIEDVKHIASNMSVIEAIRLGIVVNPKVVSCEYLLEKDGSKTRLNEDIEILNERINNIEDEKLRNEKIAQLNKLRRNLEKAKGKEEILKEHVEEGEKYIVFIPVTEKENEKEAEEKIKEKREELLKTFPNAEIYSMLGKYSDKKNSQQLNGFENSKAKGPKFMIVMNKLNEGVHVKGVKGIIWERALDENSKILALQQMGRIIRALNPGEEVKDEDRPIIIDIANNLLHVRLNEKINTYESRDDLILLRNIADWMEIHNGHIPDINSPNKEETQYGKTLKRIQEKYEKYLDGFDEEIDEEEQEKIEKIIAIGKEIDLWNIVLPEKLKKEEKIEEFELIGNLHDFYELEKEVEEITVHKTYLEIAKIIQEWTDEKRRLPSLCKEADEEEKKLAVQLTHIRRWIKDARNTRNTKEKEETKVIIEELDAKYKESKGFLVNARKIQEWSDKNGRLPSGGNEADEEEKKLAEQLGSIRTWMKDARNTKNTKEKEETKVIIEELDAKYPKTLGYLVNARKIQEWSDKKGRLPSNSKEADEEEKKLAYQLSNIRIWIGNEKEAEGKEEIRVIIEELDVKYPEISGFLVNARKIQEWSDKNERLPSRGNEADEEEKKLAEQLKCIRQWIKDARNTKNTKEKEETKVIIKELDEKYKESKGYLVNARKIQEWSDKNGRLPSNSKEADEEEKKLAYQLKYIRQWIKDARNTKEKEETKVIIEELDAKYKESKGFLVNARKIQEWSDKNGRLPSGGNEADEEEKKLAEQLGSIRTWMKDARNTKNTKEKEETKVIIEELDAKYPKTLGYLVNARKIQEWSDKKGRLPQQSKEADEEEKKLAEQLHRIRQWIKDAKNTKEKEEIRVIIEELDAKYPKPTKSNSKIFSDQDVGQAGFGVTNQKCKEADRAIKMYQTKEVIH